MLIQSARMNNIDALYLIAETYFFGKGVDRDKDLAMKYYELAAERGNIKAKKRLGQIKEIQGAMLCEILCFIFIHDDYYVCHT